MKEKIKKLKPYMVFSRFNGPEEGAFLVFAHTVQEARVTAWRSGDGNDLTDDYLDFGASLIRKAGFLWNEANPILAAKNQAHVVRNVRSCDKCGMWGHSPILANGVCQDCQDNAKEWPK